MVESAATTVPGHAKSKVVCLANEKGSLMLLFKYMAMCVKKRPMAKKFRVKAES